MRIQESQVNGIPVIGLGGRFDAESAFEVEKRLNEIIKSGVRKLIIDLGEVDYISSGGLRVLLSTAKKLDRHKGGVRLSGVTEPVKEVMEVAGFCQIFQIHDSPESAAAEFTV